MLRPIVTTALVVASSLGLLGCPANDGVPPPVDSFYYPVAAAIDAHGNWMYVVNADFDLRYNAGTVMAIDLVKVRNLIGAQQQPGGCFPDLTPVAQQDTAAGYPVWVCDVRSATGGLLNNLINPAFTQNVNPFALDAALAEYPGPNGGTGRLYVLDQGDGSITWFDIVHSDDPRLDGSLQCGPLASNGICSEAHRVGFDPAESLDQTSTLPADPSALSVDPVNGWITVLSQETDTTIPHASLLRDTAACNGTAGQVQLVNEVPYLAGGLSALALVPQSPGARSTWLAVSRTDPTFTVLQVYPGDTNACQIQLTQTPTYAEPFMYLDAESPVIGLNTGANNRDVAIDPRPDHSRAFVVSRSPEALLIVDISDLTNPVVDNVIPVAPGPSRVLPIYDPVAQHTTVYVVSYDARQIFVVDPDELIVTDEIFTNRGPHEPLLDPTMQLMYVLDFLDSTVEVIDLRPTVYGAPNPRYQHRVLTIGKPTPPQVTS